MNIRKNFETIKTKDVPYKKMYKVVLIKNLAKDSKTGMQVDILKILPMTALDPHKHGNFEWAYVLEGKYQDENGIVSKGSLRINKKSSVHTSKSKNGCTLLVFWGGKHKK